VKNHLSPYQESHSASPVPNKIGVEAGALGEPLTIVFTWSPTVPALCRIRWVVRLVSWMNAHYSPYLESHSASPVPNKMYLGSHSASPVPNKMGVEAGALGELLTIVLT
jgi:hypothetical protein